MHSSIYMIAVSQPSSAPSRSFGRTCRASAHGEGGGLSSPEKDLRAEPELRPGGGCHRIVPRDEVRKGSANGANIFVPGRLPQRRDELRGRRRFENWSAVAFPRQLTRHHYRAALTGRTFNEQVDHFDGRISGLFGDDSPDCIVVCIKPELGDLRVANPGLTPEERRALEVLRAEEESDQLALFQPSPEERREAEALYTMADDLLFRTFYRAIKARTMMHAEAVPIQILRRDTIDHPDDKGQSFATRAWHITTSIYYKPRAFRGVPPTCRATSALSGFPSIT